jgi:hypothetical protein
MIMMGITFGMTKNRAANFINKHQYSYRENEMEYFISWRLPVRIRLTSKTHFFTSYNVFCGGTKITQVGSNRFGTQLSP